MCATSTQKRDIMCNLRPRPGSLMKRAEEIEEYITGLKLGDDTPMLLSCRKTGFLGFIICLNNIFSFYDFCYEKKYVTYLLSFKLSQDFLIFFKLYAS